MTRAPFSPGYGTLVLWLMCCAASAAEPLDIWPDLAPGESTRSLGETLPRQPGEEPPVTRVTKITRPTLSVHLPEKPNGAAVVILPGGAFARVVTNKEGTEPAAWLNRHGVAAFVLSYRTSLGPGDPGWVRPLQDTQRALALVRSRASQWGLRQDRIGLLGFSAGGHAAVRLLSAAGRLAYDRVDAIDDVPHRPDFALLIYPWNLYDSQTGELTAGLRVTPDCPPTFLVHTDDDRATSLGSVLFYAGLKKRGIPAALHVFGNGGHGYGLRPVSGSAVSTWPELAAQWLAARGFVE